jgi:hypothetical protein
MVDVNFTCWYLNTRRLAELLGSARLIAAISTYKPWSAGSDLSEAFGLAAIKEKVLSWIMSSKPPTLARIVLDAEVTQGALFTYYGSFFCKGLSAYVATAGRKKAADLPVIHTRLPESLGEAQLKLQFDPK